MSWPKEYGGRDVTPLQWVIFEEEYFKAGAPARISQNGMFLLGPTLFAHGSKDQLDRVLPKMANGEEIWAQAWSGARVRQRPGVAALPRSKGGRGLASVWPEDLEFTSALRGQSIRLVPFRSGRAAPSGSDVFHV